MGNLICPHCHSNVPRGAKVCIGCKAEIDYGAPGCFVMLLFFLSGYLGYRASLLFDAGYTWVIFIVVGGGIFYAGLLLLEKIFGQNAYFKRYYRK